MNLWLTLIGVFIVQEPYSTTYFVLQAYKSGYSIYLINGLWFVVTLVSVWLAYYVGKLVKARFSNTAFAQKLERAITTFTNNYGSLSEKFLVSLAAYMVFPLAGGFLGAWLDLSLTTTIIFSFIADILWIIGIWIRVFGANAFGSNYKFAIIFVILISIIGSVIFSRMSKRFKNKNTASK